MKIHNEMIIIYDPKNGLCIPDAKVKDFVTNFIKTFKERGREIIKYIACESVIHEFRCRLALKEIKPDDIVFIFNGEKIWANEKGRIGYWPKGFCDYNDIRLETLIGI